MRGGANPAPIGGKYASYCPIASSSVPRYYETLRYPRHGYPITQQSRGMKSFSRSQFLHGGVWISRTALSFALRVTKAITWESVSLALSANVIRETLALEIGGRGRGESAIRGADRWRDAAGSRDTENAPNPSTCHWGNERWCFRCSIGAASWIAPRWPYAQRFSMRITSCTAADDVPGSGRREAKHARRGITGSRHRLPPNRRRCNTPADRLFENSIYCRDWISE